MSIVPTAYTCWWVNADIWIILQSTHSAFEGLEDEMAAVDACHPALAEHDCVAGRLHVFWC